MGDNINSNDYNQNQQQNNNNVNQSENQPNANMQSGNQQQPYQQSVNGQTQSGNQQQGYQQNNQQPYPQYQQPQYNGQSQYNGQQQYQYQQNNNQYNQPSNKGMAVASMVCGIVGLCLSCCFWYVALPASIVGLILGIISIKNNAGGRGMAIAGVVTSGITVVLALLVIFSCSSMYNQILNEIKNEIGGDSFYY